MRMSLLCCLLTLLALVGCADSVQRAGIRQPVEPVDRRLAITFDDLPWVMLRNAPPADLAPNHARLLAELKQAHVPLIGFVNEGLLYQDNTLRPERMQMLRDWLDAGFELGNHTRWHSDLHAVGVDAYEADILAGEQLLRPLLAARGSRPRWFRHPYLRTGRTLQDKRAVQDFLSAHGYRIAPVTINSSEWIFAAAYRKLLDRGAGAPELARLREAYLGYMQAKLRYYEERSIELLGYDVPQILLIHANELNASAFGDLVEMIRKQGYRFVSLDEAMQDPAYSRPDLYTSELGTSWIHRWAKAEHKPDTFFFGEAETPPWVIDLAGVGANAE